MHDCAFVQQVRQNSRYLLRIKFPSPFPSMCESSQDESGGLNGLRVECPTFFIILKPNGDATFRTKLTRKPGTKGRWGFR